MRKFNVIDTSFPVSERVINADEIIVKSAVIEFVKYDDGKTLCSGATVTAVLPHTWAIFEIE